MKQTLTIALGMAFLLLVLVLALTSDTPEVTVTETSEPAPPELASPAPGSESGPALRQGMTATLDPTGERYVQPDPEQIQRMAGEALSRSEEALSTSHEALEVRRGPEGQLSVDLQGRFRTMVVATVDDEGKISTTCVQAPQDAATPKGENK